MKKILYLLIISLSFMTTSYAFDIDINKIDINSKSNELINGLNKTYNIEINDFDKRIINDDKINNLAKELVKETLSDKSFDELYELFSKKYLYTSEDNGADTLSGALFIKMYLEMIKEKDIQADYIKEIRTITFKENDALSFVFLEDAKVDGQTEDLILAFWLKESKGEYKLFFPWLTYDKDLQNYYNEVASKEEKGEVIGGTFNKLSLDDQAQVRTIDENKLNEFYNNNKLSNVSITGMNENGINLTGSGFVIREGIVATTWSNFLKVLNDSNYVYVTDALGNTYQIKGVVAAEANYDIVLLKLEKEVLTKVKIGNSNELKTNDDILMINSKSNKNFSVSYGTLINEENGRMENLLSLSDSDVGSALYNINGQVIGFAVADSLNADFSYANSTDYLKNIQSILTLQNFNDITATSLENFKMSYYRDVNEEEVKYNNTGKKSGEYKQVGNVLKNIDLPLIKASFKDNILSLRYKNEATGMIDAMYLVSNYTKVLEDDGYEKTYDRNNKQVYIGDKYKVVIKNNLDYLIILIMEK